MLARSFHLLFMFSNHDQVGMGITGQSILILDNKYILDMESFDILGCHKPMHT